MPTDKQRLVHQQAQQTQEVFDKIAPMLVGLDPGVQGNVISMLLGTWIAGHRVVNDKDQENAAGMQRDMRAKLMAITTGAAFQHARVIDDQRGKPMEVRQ